MANNKNVQEFCIRTVNHGTGIGLMTAQSLLQPGPHLIHLQKAVANLQRLEIRFGKIENDYDEEDEFSESLVSCSLCNFLIAAQELRVLVLQPQSVFLFHEVALGNFLGFQEECWPHLAELDLCLATVGVSDLTGFLRRHCSTLRKLRLDHIDLSSDETTWLSITQEIRECLILHVATVENLFELGNLVVGVDELSQSVGKYLVEGGPNPLSQ